MNWLCRMVGHKWHKRRIPAQRTERGVQSVAVIKKCKRCGAQEGFLFIPVLAPRDKIKVGVGT